jgi:hypothetical protein
MAIEDAVRATEVCPKVQPCGLAQLLARQKGTRCQATPRSNMLQFALNSQLIHLDVKVTLYLQPGQRTKSLGELVNSECRGQARQRKASPPCESPPPQKGLSYECTWNMTHLESLLPFVYDRSYEIGKTSRQEVTADSPEQTPIDDCLFIESLILIFSSTPQASVRSCMNRHSTCPQVRP